MYLKISEIKSHSFGEDMNTFNWENLPRVIPKTISGLKKFQKELSKATSWEDLDPLILSNRNPWMNNDRGHAFFRFSLFFFFFFFFILSPIVRLCVMQGLTI